MDELEEDVWVLCDRKLLTKIKSKMYKSVVRPTMLYGMKTVAETERQMGKMKVTELKMVRWALGVTRKDKIRSEYMRETAKMAKLGYKLRNARLCWLLVWTRKKERRRLRGEKDDGDGGARQKEKRKAKEKVDECDERRHGKGWS